MALDSQAHVTNRILGALPSSDLARLTREMEIVSWPIRLPLNQAGSPIEYGYFPTSGLASVVAYLSDGSAVETGVVGREGMLGLPMLLGSGVAAHAAFVQVEGGAVRIKAAILREEFARSGMLRDLLLRYAELALSEAAQLVACNARHSLRTRCARWLLRACDALGTEQFGLTHEFLSMMLGVRRAGVSVAARTLGSAGLITYRNGLVTVLDRPGLEKAACECYRFISSETARLLPQRQLVLP